MKVAISALEDKHDSISVGESLNATVNTVKANPGQIGEGRATPLNKAQRKRALYVYVVLVKMHKLNTLFFSV
jgi:hypothetical protein